MVDLRQGILNGRDRNTGQSTLGPAHIQNKDHRGGDRNRAEKRRNDDHGIHSCEQTKSQEQQGEPGQHHHEKCHRQAAARLLMNQHTCFRNLRRQRQRGGLLVSLCRRRWRQCQYLFQHPGTSRGSLTRRKGIWNARSWAMIRGSFGSLRPGQQRRRAQNDKRRIFREAPFQNQRATID